MTLTRLPNCWDEYCAKADFVFNLAGVNRPQNPDEFMQCNFGFASTLLDTLKKHHNTCPIMISSSIQATCIGRYDGDYGRSKKAGEELIFAYGEETGAKVLVYRFPNLFGKWCRPTTTLPLRRSAITSPMICPFRSTTEVCSLNCSTLMTLLTR